ncbi:MAG: alanyl-tRNA editing protein [Candidatus Sericytochromatia bacterium]|nr:MAG: alanyl-tRNA editing protein [Candidatus Sericytochromatia bacterium]
MTTQKLYYNDSYKLDFEENILKVEKWNDKFAVLFEKTYFYPTSGGQPCDKGFINNIPVVDVIEKEGNIYHILEKNLTENKAICKIDYNTRLENSQHHTGQHLLSQAFIKVKNYPTISMHIGKDYSTIEIVASSLNIEDINKVEDLANQIIYENRKINILYLSEDEINNYSLRKKPKKKSSNNDIRVIEIENFDLSPCGGTHLKSTSEIGIIKIISFEKYKGNYRVNFLCGKKALLDYRYKNFAIKNISNKFSASEYNIEQIINKFIDDFEKNKKELNLIKKDFYNLLSKNILNDCKIINNVKVIIKEEKNYDIKDISQNLVKNQDILSFLFLENNERYNFIFSCSDNLKINLNEIARKLFKDLSFKGGGKNNFIQGSINKVEKSFLEKIISDYLNKINLSI